MLNMELDPVMKLKLSPYYELEVAPETDVGPAAGQMFPSQTALKADLGLPIVLDMHLLH